MARRPRSDWQARDLAWFAEFDALPIEEKRFRARAIDIALALAERGQLTLQTNSAEPKTVPEAIPLSTGGLSQVEAPGTDQRE